MAKRPALPPALLTYLDKMEELSVAVPRLVKAALDEEHSFRGLTVFLGDNANVVIGLKRFHENGEAQVLWTSGRDLIDALVMLEEGLRVDAWKIDKRFKP